MDGVRVCSRCQTEKSVSEFDKRRGDRARQFKAWCRDCHRKYHAWYMGRVYKRDPKAWIDKQHARHAANPIRNMVACAKRRAKKVSIEFSITVADLIMPTHCPLLGIPLIVSNGNSGPNSPSLDRIVPERGYVPGNVWIISHKANTIKSNASLEELLKLAHNLNQALFKAAA